MQLHLIPTICTFLVFSDMSGKKEDNVTDETEETSGKHSEKNSEKKNTKVSSQPITELSRKAEEEVNHLTKNQPVDSNEKLQKKSNRTLSNSTDDTEITEQSLKLLKDNNSLDTITKINETLQILDKSGESTLKNDSSSILTNSSKRFLETLKTKVDFMPPAKAHSVQEKGILCLLSHNNVLHATFLRAMPFIR